MARSSPLGAPPPAALLAAALDFSWSMPAARPVHEARSVPTTTTSWLSAPSPGRVSQTIKAKDAVKKVRKQAAWAVERGCPAGCHNFLDIIRAGKSGAGASWVGFKHQYGCALKYAVDKIRQHPNLDVADPGTFEYPQTGALLGKQR